MRNGPALSTPCCSLHLWGLPNMPHEPVILGAVPIRRSPRRRETRGFSRFLPEPKPAMGGVHRYLLVRLQAGVINLGEAEARRGNRASKPCHAALG